MLRYDGVLQLFAVKHMGKPRSERWERRWREKVKLLPRVKFVHGRDWMNDRADIREIGVYWRKDAAAPEGGMVYRHRLVLRWHFSVERR